MRYLSRLGLLVIALAATSASLRAETERQALIRIFFGVLEEVPPPGDLATIDGAADLFIKLTDARFEISGHTDRRGRPDDNMRLSERRAQAVVQRLKSSGVPEAAIQVRAFGESRPFVATSDGVSEPLNRRVEVQLFGAAAENGGEF